MNYTLIPEEEIPKKCCGLCTFIKYYAFSPQCELYDQAICIFGVCDEFEENQKIKRDIGR